MMPRDDRAPVRVLVVGMTSTAGGVENFLMTYLGRIDKTRVRFDFLTRYGDWADYPFCIVNNLATIIYSSHIFY